MGPTHHLSNQQPRISPILYCKALHQTLVIPLNWPHSVANWPSLRSYHSRYKVQICRQAHHQSWIHPTMCFIFSSTPSHRSPYSKLTICVCTICQNYLISAVIFCVSMFTLEQSSWQCDHPHVSSRFQGCIVTSSFFICVPTIYSVMFHLFTCIIYCNYTYFNFTFSFLLVSLYTSSWLLLGCFFANYIKKGLGKKKRKNDASTSYLQWSRRIRTRHNLLIQKYNRSVKNMSTFIANKYPGFSSWVILLLYCWKYIIINRSVSDDWKKLVESDVLLYLCLNKNMCILL